MVRFAFLLGALTVLSIPAASSAQTGSPEQGRAWISVGLGGGLFSGADDPGISLLVSLVLKEGPHRVSLRGALVSEVIGDGVGDLGLLYGRAWTGARSGRSVSAGAALVWGDLCPATTPTPCGVSTSVGLPLSATISFRPSRFLGLGLEAFANVNSLASFLGVGGVIELGALR